MSVMLGQMDMAGDTAPPEPPHCGGAGELLLQQGPLQALYLDGAVMQPCCWTPSYPELSLA